MVSDSIRSSMGILFNHLCKDKKLLSSLENGIISSPIRGICSGSGISFLVQMTYTLSEVIGRPGSDPTINDIYCFLVLLYQFLTNHYYKVKFYIHRNFLKFCASYKYSHPRTNNDDSFQFEYI